MQRQVLVRLQVLVDPGPIRLRMFPPNGGGGPLRKQRLLDLLVPQLSGNGHFTPAACAADTYSWTVLWETAQLRAI